MNYRLCLSLILGLWGLQTAQAQKDRFLEVYPERPFSVLKASEEGYTMTIISSETHRRLPEDESGLPWSGTGQSNYQKLSYKYMDGNLQEEIHTLPDNRRQKHLEYHYRDGLISVIDEYFYEWRKPPGKEDSTWSGELLYSYRYLYKNDGRPFDKLLVVNRKPQPLRILHSFEFDSLGRLIQQRMTHPGVKSTKDDWEIKASNELIINEYEGDSRYRRHYVDMHEMHETEETLYNEEGLPIQTRYYALRDKKRVQTGSITYTYSGKTLEKSEYALADPQTKEWRTVEKRYYTYRAEGLPERILIEEEGMQEILYFMYTNP